MNAEYKTVKLPSELIREIDRVLKLGLGYTSRADFVKEAVRHRIQDVRNGASKKEHGLFESLQRIEKTVQSIRKRI